MDFWLRFRKAEQLKWDQRLEVSSQEEWRNLIDNPNLISSVLWPTEPLFPIGGKCFNRRHAHETHYVNHPDRNQSYQDACRKLALRLHEELRGLRCLVYAPLRGALPIWRAIGQFLGDLNVDVYYPVTSSFVMYPIAFGILNAKGKPASGRYANILELERLKPMLSAYDCLVYVDEIISGGMMRGHVNEMLRLAIHEIVPIVAVGLADRFGTRSTEARSALEQKATEGKLQRFLWEGCVELISEDQKFLLGVHYADYRLGPHVIPVLDENLGFYAEKLEFDKQVM